MEEKTYVDDIDRSLYDFRNEDKDAYRIQLFNRFLRKNRIPSGCGIFA